MFIQQVEQIKKTDDILMEALENKPSGYHESTSDVKNKPSGGQTESDESDGGSESDESDGGEEGDGGEEVTIHNIVQAGISDHADERHVGQIEQGEEDLD
ncbi:hypothetical protein RHSIM_Rhsim12G0073300 [Rhododendron simsii]|uniref:Uncharacterized protein n=1 Tax=Rhododendron simsii TaxID=118357 RepID=A0A834L6T3_RHOSS|nr:hypothetical protein RHSIM_Rhsim12G0073300 [Rhododendron simsii]